MALQNFVDYVGTVTASWLNKVDVLLDTVFQNATTAAQARTALGVTATGADTTYNVRASNLSDVANAATARTNLSAAASGANTDITSLASPAIAAATATTQSSSDSSTKVATTAFAQSAISASLAQATPRVRQTVYSGPVDSNGFPAFGGSTGSTTVTASGTLYASGAIGQLDYTGGIVNPSWTGLSTNGTMYLYLDIPSTGVPATGSVSVAPEYINGTNYSTTLNKHSFSISEMTMKIGTGSAAQATNPRVFVGEVTVAGGVVTAITWYALRGQYDSGYTNTLPGTATKTSRSHNLGVVPKNVTLHLKNLTTEGNWAVDDELSVGIMVSDGSQKSAPVGKTRMSCWWTTGSSVAVLLLNATTGASFSATAANWAYRLTADRGW